MIPQGQDPRGNAHTPASSEPAYLLETLRIIEAATNHDAEKLSIFVAALVNKLRENGFAHAGKLIERAFNRSRERQLSPQSLGRTVEGGLRIPVDPETHVPLADVETLSVDDLGYEADPLTSANTSSFLSFARNRGKLLASGIFVPTNLLLHGPPGSGKTITARYVAAALGLPIITARMDAVVSSYLGNTAKNIRYIFDAASSQNVVLFLDELDAIAKARDDEHELGELKRVVIALLQNIDSVNGKLILIAATNHEHLLDPAIWRRFPHRVGFQSSTLDFRRALFARFSTGLPPVWYDALAHASRGLSAGDIREITQREQISAIIEDRLILPAALLRSTLGVASKGPGGSYMPIADVARRAASRDSKYFTITRLANLLGVSRSRITSYLRRARRAR